MDWNEHKKALEKVLTDMSKEFGEPYIGKLIASTLAEMKTQYNTPNHTLCDTIRDCILEIDTTSTEATPDIIQLAGYMDRLMNRIKKQN